jgi:hypothetical protein
MYGFHRGSRWSNDRVPTPECLEMKTTGDQLPQRVYRERHACDVSTTVVKPLDTYVRRVVRSQGAPNKITE